MNEMEELLEQVGKKHNSLKTHLEEAQRMIADLRTEVTSLTQRLTRKEGEVDALEKKWAVVQNWAGQIGKEIKK